jgi:SagB-type dehydrogenase family enzyme
VVRAERGLLRAESGRSSIALELRDPRCAPLLGMLAGGTTSTQAATALPDLPEDAVVALMAMFHEAGLLTPADPAHDPEDEQQPLAQWSSTDLLLHATSRLRLRTGGYGGTYRLADRFSALPADTSFDTATSVKLATPDLIEIAAQDPRLTDVLEQRRSLREHDETRPITAEQLGTLLFRTVRVRRSVRTDKEELVDRPFPAGGSLHELEVYPVVSNCPGLDPGVWHYNGVQHAFEKVADPSSAMRALVAQARVTSMMQSDPQVLLVVAARFGRVMWKYESMAYALILKHVGVLYQTLYLTATAMGLAPCAQGGGDADLFAAASGLDYFTEGSVGEFIIGSAAGHAASMWEAAGP